MAHSALASPGVLEPFEATVHRGSILEALGLFRWRLAFVAAFCAVVATEVLAQPDVFEYWTLEAIVAGFFDLYVQCLSYGVTILLALAAAERLLPRLLPVAKPVVIGLAIVAGAFAGGVVEVF